MLESNFNSRGQYDIPEGYEVPEISEEEKQRIIDEWYRPMTFEEIVEKYGFIVVEER